MIGTKTRTFRRIVMLGALVALLALSLLLVACGSSTGASNVGNSNISSNNGQTTSQTTPTTSNSSGGIQDANQQVQNAIQSIDGAQNDTNNADATATSEGGAPQQP